MKYHQLAGLLSALVIVPAFAEVPAPSEQNRSESMVGGIIVKYRGISQSALAQAAGQIKGGAAPVQASDQLQQAQHIGEIIGVPVQFHHQMGTGAYVFTVKGSMTAIKAHAYAKKIQQQDSSVEYAEPDYINTHQYVPSSPLFASKQWEMQGSDTQPGAMNLPAAWDITKGDGVTVAVIDTGIRLHKDVQANILPGYNFITDPVASRMPGVVMRDANGRPLLNADGSVVITARTNDALDRGDYTVDGQCGPGAAGRSSSWHGTHVAGTIAANAGDNNGLTGVAPKAKVVPVRVLGACGGMTSDITDGMIWAAGGVVPGVPVNPTPARVLNLSLGGAEPCSRTYRETIQAVTNLGAIVVVAAGNDVKDSRSFEPASCPGIITVASNGPTSGIASYSNYGAFTTVTAPGGDFVKNGMIYSTVDAGATTPTGDAYTNMVGTSMATPHVVGLVALMLSANPKLDYKSVRKLLIKTARQPVADCEGCAAGIVDAAAAVAAAKTYK